MKTLALISLCLLSLVAASHAQREMRFNSILVRPEGSPHRNAFLIDFDKDFAWMARHFGDHRDFGGNTTAGLFVYSKPHDRWLQIMEVSTANAVFGKSPPDAMIQSPWDFTALASKAFVPLPIPTGGAIHHPDKVTVDDTRKAFILHFDSRPKIESQTTTLLIPKKDLKDAFDHYAKRK